MRVGHRLIRGQQRLPARPDECCQHAEPDSDGRDTHQCDAAAGREPFGGGHLSRVLGTGAVGVDHDIRVVPVDRQMHTSCVRVTPAVRPRPQRVTGDPGPDIVRRPRSPTTSGRNQSRRSAPWESVHPGAVARVRGISDRGQAMSAVPGSSPSHWFSICTVGGGFGDGKAEMLCCSVTRTVPLHPQGSAQVG